MKAQDTILYDPTIWPQVAYKVKKPHFTCISVEEWKWTRREIDYGIYL